MLEGHELALAQQWQKQCAPRQYFAVRRPVAEPSQTWQIPPVVVHQSLHTAGNARYGWLPLGFHHHWQPAPLSRQKPSKQVA